MERLEQKDFNNESKEKPPLRVIIFRHGKAKYEQGKVSIDQADDLDPEEEINVDINAEKIAGTIGPEEEVEIWSSPYGRNLHTAKKIAKKFEEKNIKLRKKADDAQQYGIRIFGQLEETRNFSWQLFEPLMIGGEMEYGGKKFIIDKALTNPKNLYYPEFFVQDEIANIPPEVKKTLPEDYVKRIEEFEKFIDATRRMMKALARLKKIGDKPYTVVIVTHDALTGFIADVFSEGSKKGINPGEYIELERKEGKMTVSSVGFQKEGRSDIDVVDEFDRQDRSKR